jgi:hypothetical protein
MVLFTALLLGGCAAATVENPQTGEKLSCSEGALDISPWSQSEGCVANHIAQGWVIASGR